MQIKGRKQKEDKELFDMFIVYAMISQFLMPYDSTFDPNHLQ